MAELDCLSELKFNLGSFGLVGNQTGPGPLTYYKCKGGKFQGQSLW